MKWITRAKARVDRIACPWLVKRFIDPEAEFMYVPAAEVTSIAERDGAIPYDVGGVELGHVDGRCSFESIILKYGLHDPALDRLAQTSARTSTTRRKRPASKRSPMGSRWSTGKTTI